jgi:hypothetical protein
MVVDALATTHWQRRGRSKVETSAIVSIANSRQFDWDRVGVLFATFGIACSGIARVLYSVGFLIQAWSHHA